MRLFVLVATLASGCSLGLSTDIPREPARSANCTESRVRPVTDLLGATAFSLGAIGGGGSAGSYAVVGAGLGIVGVYGLVQTSRCRRFNTERGRYLTELELKSAEPGKSDAVAGPPEVVEGHREIPPQPAPRPTLGDRCELGATCPRGAVCDPLTFRCQAEAALGSENGPCRGGRACDAGLFCDDGLCRPGRSGRDGGLCRADGGCDAGFQCPRELCVREAQPRPPATTSGRARGETGLERTRAGEPPPSDHP